MDDLSFWLYIISIYLVFKYIEWEPPVDPEDELTEEEIIEIRKKYEG